MLNRSITVIEATGVLNDVRALLKKNGNNKREIGMVEAVLLNALGTPINANVIAEKSDNSSLAKVEGYVEGLLDRQIQEVAYLEKNAPNGAVHTAKIRMGSLKDLLSYIKSLEGGKEGQD